MGANLCITMKPDPDRDPKQSEKLDPDIQTLNLCGSATLIKNKTLV